MVSCVRVPVHKNGLVGNVEAYIRVCDGRNVVRGGVEACARSVAHGDTVACTLVCSVVVVACGHIAVVVAYVHSAALDDAAAYVRSAALDDAVAYAHSAALGDAAAYIPVYGRVQSRLAYEALDGVVGVDMMAAYIQMNRIDLELEWPW